MRLVYMTALALLISSPALASGGGKKSEKGKSNRIKAEWTIKNDVIPEYKIPDPSQSLRSVDIPVVVAPISIDGHLVNYAFLAIRVVLDDNVDAWKMRSKAHFMRDAILRTAHKYPFGKDGARTEVDEERVLPLIREAIAPWVSKQQIDHIEFLSIDMLNG
ncbi:MAG: hypothetical protein COA84_14645 [Robiginitomaculum sp.]|nr:MAG: hypothetical protein COA84_14645 [Robiginitomaculum sp.]